MTPQTKTYPPSEPGDFYIVATTGDSLVTFVAYQCVGAAQNPNSLDYDIALYTRKDGRRNVDTTEKVDLAEPYLTATISPSGYSNIVFHVSDFWSKWEALKLGKLLERLYELSR